MASAWDDDDLSGRPRRRGTAPRGTTAARAALAVFADRRAQLEAMTAEKAHEAADRMAERKSIRGLEIEWNKLRVAHFPALARVPEHFGGKLAAHAKTMLSDWGWDVVVEFLTWTVTHWPELRWEERLGDLLEDAPTFGQVFAFRDRLSSRWATEVAEAESQT